MSEITNFRGDVVEGEGRSGDVDAFIAKVGERVRKVRHRKGMARRVLSELSGVSQRYLAQLENGDGNISIGLLHKVARGARSSHRMAGRRGRSLGLRERTGRPSSTAPHRRRSAGM